MKLIAHRGNRYGPNIRENEPEYINEAIFAGFYVEIDLWKIDNELFLGHDKPQYKINTSFFNLKESMYVHAKNIDALYFLVENNINCFFHINDDAVLTLQGEIWTFPGKQLTPKSIFVMPEWITTVITDTNIAGICSDYVALIQQDPTFG